MKMKKRKKSQLWKKRGAVSRVTFLMQLSCLRGSYVLQFLPSFPLIG
jgi:hypothetical protein